MADHLPNTSERRARFLVDLLCVAFPAVNHLLTFAELLEPGTRRHLRTDTGEEAAWSYVDRLRTTGSLNLEDEAQVAVFVREIFLHAKTMRWEDVQRLAQRHDCAVEPAPPARPDGRSIVVLDAPALSLVERFAFIKALENATNFEYQIDAYKIEGQRTYLSLCASREGSAALRGLGRRRLTRITGRPVSRIVRQGSVIAVVIAILCDVLRHPATSGFVVTALGVTVVVMATQRWEGMSQRPDMEVAPSPEVRGGTTGASESGGDADGTSGADSSSGDTGGSTAGTEGATQDGSASADPPVPFAVEPATGVQEVVPGTPVPEAIKRATWDALCKGLRDRTHFWEFNSTLGGLTWFIDTTLRSKFFPRGSESTGQNYTVRVLKDWSGLPAFSRHPRGGPEFGRWNPEVVRWVAHHFLPAPDTVICGDDVRAIAVYEGVFRDYFRLAAVALAFHVENDTLRKVNAKSYDYDLCTEAQRGVCANSIIERYRSFIADLRWGINLDDSGLSVHDHFYHFWIRRHIDGSLDEFAGVLQRVLESYDPEFWRLHGARLSAWSNRVTNQLPNAEAVPHDEGRE